MPFITQSPGSVDAYVAHFSRQPLPVLRRTARELDVLRADMERASGKQIVAVVLSDPLMTLKLLTHMERRRSRSQNNDIATVNGAIMMMGVKPFFDTFVDMPTVEDVLSAHPRGLLGVLKVISNARRAAHHARDWAIARHDFDVDEITIAALLRETADIVCCIFAPALTEQVRTMQAADSTLRSAVAQHIVFGVTMHEVQLALIRAWKLPGLLVQLIDETQADNPRVRTITLAADFARHVAHGWDNAALPDDVAAIERLLPFGREQLLLRLGAPRDAIARFLSPASGADHPSGTA